MDRAYSIVASTTIALPVIEEWELIVFFCESHLCLRYYHFLVEVSCPTTRSRRRGQEMVSRLEYWPASDLERWMGQEVVDIGESPPSILSQES